MPLIAPLIVGCTTMGPTTIPRDRFDYAAAISESWKNQMLLNLVKARYSDAPVFLDIASAINSYSLETDVNVAAYRPSLRRSQFATLKTPGSIAYLAGDGAGADGAAAEAPTTSILAAALSASSCFITFCC